MELLVEHDMSPGTIYENKLILGGACSAVLNEMDLHESSGASGTLVKFKGKFQEAEAVNKNKRMYPFDVLDSNVNALNECISNGGLIGELDHPTDSIIHFANASHKVSKLWWDGKTLMGEGVILNTPSGKILKALINDGVRVGISSRGVGNGKVNEEGILVIGESYKLITFDAVADPSTSQAFQERVVSKESIDSIPVPQAVESKKSEDSLEAEVAQEVTTVESKEEHEEIANKNESSSIDRLSKDLIIAAFGNIVQEQASKLKTRSS